MEDELGMQECETLRVFDAFHAPFSAQLSQLCSGIIPECLAVGRVDRRRNHVLPDSTMRFGALCSTCINKLRFAQKLRHDVFVNRLNRRPFHLPRIRLIMKLNCRLLYY